MEASSLQIIQNYVKTPSISVDPPKTIKMEDLTNGISPSTPASSSLLDIPTETPKSDSSKTVKKRKSWGQVLPEPKTNLPPRKRAKTADEKEQRRIERVKRNRLAAHNSRERKRQEVDALQERNDKLEAQMRLMQAQLDAYKAKFPDAIVPTVPPLELAPLPDFSREVCSLPVQQPTSVPTDFITQIPGPMSVHSFSSPDSMLSTIDSPIDTAPSTPGMTMMEASDRTQQSAVLLSFDLQCQPEASSSTSTAPTPSTHRTKTSSNSPTSMTTVVVVLSTSPSFPRTTLPSSTRASTAKRGLVATARPVDGLARRSRSLARASSLRSLRLARLPFEQALHCLGTRRRRLDTKHARRPSQAYELGGFGANHTIRTRLLALSLSTGFNRSRIAHRRRGRRGRSSCSSTLGCHNTSTGDVMKSLALVKTQLASEWKTQPWRL